MRERVQELVRKAALRVVREVDPEQEPRAFDVQLVPAKQREHGDFASNVALTLSKPLRLKPRDLAERIVSRFEDPEGIVDRLEIAGPGFINLFLASDRWHELLARILRDGKEWGRSPVGRGVRVMVEFVSANPTGPLTIGHGRNAVLGDCAARLLEAIGCDVTREYYYNDGGRQMEVLAVSLRARYEQALGRDTALPDEGYRGDYLIEIARDLVERHQDALLEAEDERFRDEAKRAMFADIEATLDRLAIRFDVRYNEKTLYDEGLVEKALEDLRAAGQVYESEGAVWLRAKDAGFERDRVLVRSSGAPTYLLPDIAYHREKLRRGFARVIDVLGPDHIEQFPYVRYAIGALGLDPKGMEVVHYQWVNLRRGGELVKMSTRAGSFVTVDEVLSEVGADVFRYFMLDRRADTHLDFDLDLARERSERNPVYKIQYAHTRLCSIERKAEEAGIDLGAAADLPLDRLELPEEQDLVKRLGRYPDCVLHAADTHEPQEIGRYLLDLATAFHTYVSDGRRHRVLSDDVELSRARLALMKCIRVTISNALELLGIAAPERM